MKKSITFVLRVLVGWVCLLTSGAVWAQPLTVSGKVTSGGEGLPGVNIVVLGTTTGTVSDAEGRYVPGAAPRPLGSQQHVPVAE